MDNQKALKAHAIAKSKGFWDKERNEQELIMLIISELGEALEAHRKNRVADWFEFIHSQQLPGDFEKYIKDTVGDELADAAIRIMDYMAYREWEVQVPEFNFSGVDNFGARLLTIVRVLIYHQEGNFNQALGHLDLLCRDMKIDLSLHIDMKFKYNQTRDKLHGKAY